MNRERSFIETEVVLLPEQDWGRHNPLQSCAYNGGYRPHIVLQERTVRNATIEFRDGQRCIVDEYLGVAFWSGPDQLPVGTSFLLTMILFYFPRVAYEGCVPGATFTIREGGKIIGHGEIKRRRTENT